MSKKTEAAQIREHFWMTLGRYLAPVPSSEGMKINWINYKTGVPGLQFKMMADQHQASIGIAINHPDADIRALLFNQLLELKTMVNDEFDNKLLWPEPDFSQDLYIYQKISKVNIYDENTWPEMITFFKENLIALDQWWALANYGFEDFKSVF